MQSLQLGTTLQGGKYRIESVLGQGGFGITYLAEQEMLGRKVAIKEFFMREYCNRNIKDSSVTTISSTAGVIVDRFKKKFVSEAKTIAKFRHPNIIDIYDIFLENNTAYYVMEFIDSKSLEDLVKQKGALPEKTAIEYIRQVGDALVCMHEKNINHLDVKPNNIMLRSNDKEVVLIDFGISKQYDEEGKELTTTLVGVSEGYAPLEQYQKGSLQEFSPQTDIYSLGATLYKLIEGKTPPEAYNVLLNGLSFSTKTPEYIQSAIREAMKTLREQRPKNIKEFIDKLHINSAKKEETIILDEHSIDGREYVDLGLPSGTLWATCNVGANRPEEYGDYFAWGETKVKRYSKWYKWSNSPFDISGSLTKYCNDRIYGNEDGLTELELEDDAAYISNRGTDWRTPSIAQFEELINSNYTTTTWMTLNGVCGCKITSKTNGKSIFLPAAGYRCNKDFYTGSLGRYWSRTLKSDDPNWARYLYIDSASIGTSNFYRYYGQSVRPVCTIENNAQ